MKVFVVMTGMRDEGAIDTWAAVHSTRAKAVKTAADVIIDDLDHGRLGLTAEEASLLNVLHRHQKYEELVKSYQETVWSRLVGHEETVYLTVEELDIDPKLTF